MATTDINQVPLDSIIRHVVDKVRSDRERVKSLIDNEAKNFESFDVAVGDFRASLRALDILEQSAREQQPREPRLAPQGGRAEDGVRPFTPRGTFGGERRPADGEARPRTPVIDMQELENQLGTRPLEADGSQSQAG